MKAAHVWCCQSLRRTELKSACYRFCASCHCLLSWQTPWREKFVLSAEKPIRRRNSNGSRSGACALIFPPCHGRVPLLSHARCQTFCNFVTQILSAEKPIRRRNSNGSRSGACALIFPPCHGRVPLLSHARCQTFCNYVTQMNASVLQLII